MGRRVFIGEQETQAGRGGLWRRHAGLLVFPVALIYLELLLRLASGIPLGESNVPGAVLAALSAGCLLDILSTLTASRRANWRIGLALLELCVLAFAIEFFLNNSYQVFMDPASVFSGVGDVMTGFGDTLFSVITSGFLFVILFHLPVVAYLILAKRYVNFERRGLRPVALLLALMLLCWSLSVLAVTRRDADRAKYCEEYGFDSAVRSFGVLTALRLDARYTLFGNPYEASFVFLPVEQPLPAETPAQPAQPVPTPPSELSAPDGEGTPVEPEPEPAPEPVVYGWNMLDLDFAALAEQTTDATIRGMHEYVASLAPSRQNEYTGLFAGKNLILITAEAFSAEVIDPELTPTLYRLAHQGIVFEDYYQPAWGGSTSTGEYSALMGLVPTNGVASIKNTIGHNLYLTIGNQLQRLGYFSLAYHNGSYTYYDRNRTHTNFGYADFIGMGNGMEAGVTNCWPESDLEMMQFTLDQYIDQQPFSVYYMTVSGHCLYSWGGNSMSSKNREAVQALDCSETVKAYYAANLELEYALAELVERLEAAGIADDTVIVMTTDHYPYGLENSASWGNDRDYLAELYGYPADSAPARDHSALILWSGCLETRETPIVVETPVYSLDILPTLSNLFGVAYDSRLLVGRDVLSDAEPLVLWGDYDWLTDKGYYDSSRGVFTPKEGVEVDETYVERIKATVRNKIVYSKNALGYDYFGVLFGAGQPDA